MFPFGGSVLALIFYELIFVKTLEYLEGDDEAEGDELEETMGTKLISTSGHVLDDE